jgi:alpha-mannosidase
LCANLADEAAVAIFAEESGSITLLNSLSHSWERPFTLPESWGENAAVTADGTAIPTQLGKNGKVTALVSVPAMGALTIKKSSKPFESSEFSEKILENDLVRYEFADDGSITSCFDKELNREFIPDGGKANLFKLIVDRPVNYDAWDIDFFHEDADCENATTAVLSPLENGPVLKSLLLKLEIGNSRISQKIYLAANSKRIEFETEIDWRECHSMLRVSFPTTVSSSEFTADIQYGHIKRPTHRNTSWEMAKFETSAIRYVDLSDNDFGAALMNDCKYGHKVLDNVIELTLLRSPTEPDPIADQGDHSFTYAFLPHAGIMIDSSVIEEAAALNNPPASFANRSISAEFAPPVSLNSTTVSLEALKRSERSESWIARVVETRGRESSAELAIKEGLTVRETDLMERPLSANLATGGKLKLNLKPFEIKTFEIFK